MLVAWLGVALAGDEGALQAIHELEWNRGDVLGLAAQGAGSGPGGRAAAMRAAGRLRTNEALELLQTARNDADPEVQLAGAEALAWTPGSAPLVREWLSATPLPVGVVARTAAERGLTVVLLEALGHQGDAGDLSTLVRYLEEPWPIGSAAARALGRLGVRKVAGAEQAVAALSARIDAPDPRLAAEVAWALSRIGMKAAGPLDVERVLVRLRLRDTYPVTRARLVRAVWPGLDTSTRSALFVELATDPSRLVRVALLDALTPGDVGPEVLVAWLADRDPWIRQAAIGALGREGTDDARDLLAQHRSDDPYEQAAVIRARRVSDPAAATDLEIPAVLRAASASALTDPALLERLALSDPEPSVRSAAVQVLLDEPKTPAVVGQRLLAATDPAIREAAIDILGRGPREWRVNALLTHLSAEKSADVQAAALQALLDAKIRRPQVEAALAAVGDGDPRVVQLAGALARSVGVKTKDVPRRLPSPDLAEVGTFRRAVVATSEGTFIIALDPDVAPLAVANFVDLAREGYFDSDVFHRVVPGFVVQTGCPRGDGWGGPGYTIPDEVSALPFDTGAVGMARAARDTGGSQWFVTTSPQPHLVGEYTRFGQVVSGMHVVERLHPGSKISRVSIVARDGTPLGKPR